MNNNQTLEERVKQFNGEALRLARKSKGLSREEVSYRADLHINSLASYERGDKDPTSFQLLKIAQVLGIDDLDQIFKQSKKEIYPFIQNRMDNSSTD
ncbi:helix-turn-helix domain-containing protein [Salipaludibacillus sp. HK11]|uniref:helix-turn-helix domain-containing protein n=1 Tax=Salipaludibacillus sp. HK11 TaxID=3394320 RepID=UPI0039FBD5B1